MDIERYIEELAASAGLACGDASESLKGSAIELWRLGDRFVLVADERDRAVAMAQGDKPGELWTAAELELVARIEDQSIRTEVERWKRAMDGRVREFCAHPERP